MTGCSPQVIVLGPPGAGKGTQAERLAERLGLVHISPGQILREEVAPASSGQEIRRAMAAGELVSDDLVDGVVRERLEKLEPDQGFVLDGYPRNSRQAMSLPRMLSQLDRLQRRTVVVWLEVPRQALVKRLRERRQAEGRVDDAEESVPRRLQLDASHAGAALEALGKWFEVAVIDGDRPPHEVTEEILAHLCPSVPATAG
jgi:adenylate kinase